MNDTVSRQPSSPEQIAQAFLTPRAPQGPTLALDGGEGAAHRHPEGVVALQRAGTGPMVLLLHGWDGQASDLAAFARPLQGAGLACWRWTCRRTAPRTGGSHQSRKRPAPGAVGRALGRCTQ